VIFSRKKQETAKIRSSKTRGVDLFSFFIPENDNSLLQSKAIPSLTSVRRDIIQSIFNRRLGLFFSLFIMELVYQFPSVCLIITGLQLAAIIGEKIYSRKRRNYKNLFFGLVFLDISVISLLFALVNQDTLQASIIFLFYFSNLYSTVPVLLKSLNLFNGILTVFSYCFVIAISGLIDSFHITGGIILGLAVYGSLTLIKVLQDGFEQTIQFYRSLKAKRERQSQLTNEKAEFLANINHELRTPLNGILGMTSLLLESELSEEQKDFASGIKNSSELLLSLINDILDMSRIEAGYLRLEKRSFDLVRSFYIVRDNLRPSAGDKKISLDFIFNGKIPKHVQGDATRLGQILFNIVGNSVKFTSKGGVSVEVKVQPKPEKTCLLTIIIKDTGIGIAQENLPMLFEKYRQASADIQKQYGGTGLGLAISKELIQRMGGDISVESQINKGSTFTVLLPFDCEEDPQTWKYLSKDDPKHHLQNPDPPKKNPINPPEEKIVFLIDDNAVNLDLLSRMVQRSGFLAETCNSSLNSLERLKALSSEEKLALAIIDYQMPEMNGKELISAYRSWEKEAGKEEIPICILSGHGVQSIASFFNAIPKVEIIEKPIRLEQLRELLNRYIH